MAAEERCKELVEAINRDGYNCACQEGGIDAMSIDTDWLEVVSDKFVESIEAIQRVREAINQVIHRNGNQAGYVNKEESLRYLYAVEMARYILNALDGEQE